VGLLQQQRTAAAAASLALWMQRHSAVLAHVQLCGSKSGMSSAWWHNICSSQLSSPQVKASATLHCLCLAVDETQVLYVLHVQSVLSTKQQQLVSLSVGQQAHISGEQQGQQRIIPQTAAPPAKLNTSACSCTAGWLTHLLAF
jgi:hypothetical protein